MKNLNRVFLLSVLSVFFLGLISSDIAKLISPPDSPIAIVRRFKPNVLIQNQEADKKITLDLEDNKAEKLYSGDTLATDQEGYALVMFMDRSIAKVKPLSMLILNGEVSNATKYMSTRINLQEGETFMEVQPQGNNTFEVSTSISTAVVKGTDFGSNSGGYTWVENGQVDVTAINSGQTISLFEKMYAQVDPQGNSIQSGTLTDDELNQLGQGYNELENDLIKKTIKLRFRDENGQVREVEIDVFVEEDQN